MAQRVARTSAQSGSGSAIAGSTRRARSIEVDSKQCELCGRGSGRKLTLKIGPVGREVLTVSRLQPYLGNTDAKSFKSMVCQRKLGDSRMHSVSTATPHPRRRQDRRRSIPLFAAWRLWRRFAAAMHDIAFRFVARNFILVQLVHIVHFRRRSRATYIPLMIAVGAACGKVALSFGILADATVAALGHRRGGAMRFRPRPKYRGHSSACSRFARMH